MVAMQRSTPPQHHVPSREHAVARRHRLPTPPQRRQSTTARSRAVYAPSGASVWSREPGRPAPGTVHLPTRRKQRLPRRGCRRRPVWTVRRRWSECGEDEGVVCCVAVSSVRCERRPGRRRRRFLSRRGVAAPLPWPPCSRTSTATSWRRCGCDERREPRVGALELVCPDLRRVGAWGADGEVEARQGRTGETDRRRRRIG